MSRIVEALKLKVSGLQKELDQTKKTLKAVRLENTRLAAEAQNDRECLQNVRVSTSWPPSICSYCAPFQEAGQSMFSSNPPTAPLNFRGQGTQAYDGPQGGIQQQRY